MISLFDVRLWNSNRYPSTVLQDRYGGTYSGGDWLAFPLEPGEIDEDVLGDDVSCMCFWERYKEPVGKGNSPSEAFMSLVVKMKYLEDTMTQKLKEWRDNMFAEAAKQTKETLSAFMEKYLAEGDDYERAPEVVAACACAASWAASNVLGITGFQANFAMWEYIKAWHYSNNRTGLRIIDFDDMLYPQMEQRFDKVITQRQWERIVEVAKEKLNEGDGAPEVRNHWEKIVAGEVPFGYRIAEDVK